MSKHAPHSRPSWCRLSLIQTYKLDIYQYQMHLIFIFLFINSYCILFIQYIALSFHKLARPWDLVFWSLIRKWKQVTLIHLTENHLAPIHLKRNPLNSYFLLDNVESAKSIKGGRKANKDRSFTTWMRHLFYLRLFCLYISLISPIFYSCLIR